MSELDKEIEKEIAKIAFSDKDNEYELTNYLTSLKKQRKIKALKITKTEKGII